MTTIDFKRKALSHLTAAVAIDAEEMPIGASDYSSILGGTDPVYLVLRGPADREIVAVDTANSVWGSYIKVSRGQGGTSPVAWPTGTLIFASTIAEGYNNMEQQGEVRTIDYNPNEILAPLYKGEKVYQSGPAGCERWWKSWDGTNPYWDIITGAACGDEQYTDIGWTYDILKPAVAWVFQDELYTETPSQQDVATAAFDVTNGDLYVGTKPDAQIWRSTDAGVTWALMWDFSNETTGADTVNGIMHDPANDAMYCITFPYGRVWKSSNRGVTWSLVMDKGIGAFAFVGGELGYDPTNDVIYAGLFDSDGTWGANLYKSADQGSTWPLVQDFHVAEPFVDGIKSFAYDATRTRLYMGTSGRAQVWTSDNGAAFVKRVDFLSLELNEINAAGMAYDVSRDIVICAVGNNGRIWTSIDGGVNWLEKVRLEIVAPHNLQQPSGLLYNPDNDWTFATFGDGGVVMVSKDGGATWSVDKDDFNTETATFKMAYDSINKRNIAGTGPKAEIWSRKNS